MHAPPGPPVDDRPPTGAGGAEVPALRVRALGRAEVFVNGKPARWTARCARDLFFILLSHPEGRPRDDLLADLWGPGADPAGADRLRGAAHHLRAALGWGGAVREAQGAWHLAPEVFRSADVYDLYAALHLADTSGPRAGRRALERALEVYGGDYLPHDRAGWAARAREEHRAAYLRACTELSLLHCEDGACGPAVRVLGRALGTDPLLGETYHQRLMTCLSALEGKYAATEHYRRFLRFLRAEVNDAPLPETVRLAHCIKGGERLCPRPPSRVEGARAEGPSHPCPHRRR